MRHDHGARAISEDRRLEARCNAIAADLLMPAADILASDIVREHAPGYEWALQELIEAAKPFGVSVESLLRRLVTLNRVPLTQYSVPRGLIRAGQARQRTGKGKFYLVKARDLGKALRATVVGARERQVIDSTTAASVP